MRGEDGIGSGKEGIVIREGWFHVEYVDACAGDISFFNASARALLSTTPPLAVLMRMASFLMRESFSLSMKCLVSAVRGRWMETMSLVLRRVSRSV